MSEKKPIELKEDVSARKVRFFINREKSLVTPNRIFDIFDVPEAERFSFEIEPFTASEVKLIKKHRARWFSELEAKMIAFAIKTDRTIQEFKDLFERFRTGDKTLTDDEFAQMSLANIEVDPDLDITELNSEMVSKRCSAIIFANGDRKEYTTDIDETMVNWLFNTIYDMSVLGYDEQLGL